jgi:hydroxymethylpyrimidine pyrophosphatase-like HAD family hydrolase
MKVVISTELNENSRIPQWLVEAVRAAERAGVQLTIRTGRVYKVVKPRKVARG